MIIDINIITKFSLFSSLSQPTLEAVQSCITSRSCLAEEVIQLEGEEFQWVGYFALRDKSGAYRGTIEVSQDVAPIRALQGERRLLDD